MQDVHTSSRAVETAGLALSVGQASVATRVFLATVVLATALIVAAAGFMVARTPAGRVVAIALIEPLAIIGFIAAAFIAAPRSRFGIWLDRFVPRLRDAKIALLTALILFALAATIVARAPSADGAGPKAEGRR